MVVMSRAFASLYPVNPMPGLNSRAFSFHLTAIMFIFFAPTIPRKFTAIFTVSVSFWVESPKKFCE